jgi:hypothetical protein
MEVKFKEKVVTKKIVTLELDESEALILCKIVGNIGGNHDWRKVTSGIYNGINDALGYDKCHRFSDKHDHDIERSMFLRDKDRPSIMDMLDNVGQRNA